MDSPHDSRLRKLRALLAGHGADAFVSFHAANLFYLCGFSGSSGALWLDADQAILFTDSRYTLQARQEVKGIRVQIVKKGLLMALAERLKHLRRPRIAVEASRFTLSQKSYLEKTVAHSIRFLPVEGLVEGLRAVKDHAEVALMRDAAGLGSLIFDEILPFVRPGIRECELAGEIDYRMRRRGASGSSFDTIVAFGERSALPHAFPTDRRLRKNELVLLDWGAILRHYCCDLTRTVYVGRAPAKVRRWYEAVLGAQEAARGAVRPGVTSGAVDAAARKVLGRSGLVRYFTHSTGHGLGIEVHENPRLAKGQKTELQAGQVLTLEPGVYIEGVGGIRIEDDVLVTPNGPEVLTTARRELMEL